MCEGGFPISPIGAHNGIKRVFNMVHGQYNRTQVDETLISWDLSHDTIAVLSVLP